MSEILNFPTKKPQAEATSPLDMLRELVDAMEKGETSAETLVISWNEPSSDDHYYQLRYMIGGNCEPARVVGLLEMVKSDILS